MIKANNLPNNVIAAFDFDGTITTKDTLFDFIIFSVGWLQFIVGALVFVPTFVSYLLKKITNHEAKEVMFSIFFKDMETTKFQELGEKYKMKIAQILNDEAIKKIEWHKSNGHQIIIVSASIENWITPWAMSFGFENVIATKIELKDGRLTGRFSSKNCSGLEKTSRLIAEYPNRGNYILYAYGDSTGDAELLKLADYPFFKNFN